MKAILKIVLCIFACAVISAISVFCTAVHFKSIEAKESVLKIPQSRLYQSCTVTRCIYNPFKNEYHITVEGTDPERPYKGDYLVNGDAMDFRHKVWNINTAGLSEEEIDDIRDRLTAQVVTLVKEYEQ